MQPSVLIRGLSKAYEGRPVLESLDFQLAPGTITGLLGRNGAGKSTLIQCLLGIIGADSGEACIHGVPARDLDAPGRHRIGYVPQVFEGFAWMRVRDLLRYIGAFYATWEPVRVAQMVRGWALDPTARVGRLSEGQKQMLAIVLALGHDPDLLILDEPVASLDPAARRAFIEQLIEIGLDGGKTVLFSTHITSDLERVAADVAVLQRGRIRFQGGLDALKERVLRVAVQADTALPSTFELARVLSAEVMGTSAVLTVEVDDPGAITAWAEQRGYHVRIDQLSLEDIFLALERPRSEP